VRNRHRALALAAGALVAAAAPAAASAAVYCVHQSGSCAAGQLDEGANLQQALTDAAGHGGPDSIAIGPGTYPGNVDYTSSEAVTIGGSGVATFGPATISQSTLQMSSGSAVSAFTGANPGRVDVTDSTLSGYYGLDAHPGLDVYVRRVRITATTAGPDAGVGLLTDCTNSGSATAQLTGSIVRGFTVSLRRSASMGSADIQVGTSDIDLATAEESGGRAHVVDAGNVDVDPGLVSDTDAHLRADSPVIDLAGTSSASGGLDLDGNPRLAGAAQDMGAYEYQPPVVPVALTSPGARGACAWSGARRSPTTSSPSGREPAPRPATAAWACGSRAAGARSWPVGAARRS
jgi:hypothetical protein